MNHTKIKMYCKYVTLLSLFFALSVFAGNYQVGVYYFPGWKNNQIGAPSKKPWDSIKAYPEREPMLGWYDDGDPQVVDQQIDWMVNYGINYIIYDWYWSEGNTPFLEHGVKTFLKSSNNAKIKFAFMWANHDKQPVSIDNFAQMITYLCDHYFVQKNYQTIDGKPVVFIFSQQNLVDKAKLFGKTQADLLRLARQIAKSKGFNDLYIVGNAEAVDYWVKDQGPKAGYDAFSAYNYHRGFSGKFDAKKPFSHNYLELDEAYQESWEWILQNSDRPYFIPAITGWDKRPWGGSKLDALHDNSSSTPEEFKDHLLSAKRFADKYPAQSMKNIVICCWNEYGEGSILEPTKKFGFEYLKAVKETFN